ncbi:MAG TPA: sigma-70 family RNA polymerase sigma factor [Acidimicrobiales bacterium]|nr:sigma-70 family RNA polymerase sigma factor [Acidimicrobiales bacterium]
MLAHPVEDTRQQLEEKLVRENLALVDYAVNQLVARLPRYVPRDELVSAAMAGLAQAARSFDPDRDIRFDHYAPGRIRGALLDELRSRDWASRSVRTKARRLLAVTDDLTAELGRTPTTEELATKMGMATKAVDDLAGDLHRSVVLNYESIVDDGGDGEWTLPADDRSPDVVLLDRERRAYLLDAVAALPDRLREVVVGYFFEERSMQDLADELGVSASRISQMRTKAMGLLKEAMLAQLEPEAMVQFDHTPRVARRRAAYRAAVAKASTFRDRVSSVPSRAIDVRNAAVGATPAAIAC